MLLVGPRLFLGPPGIAGLTTAAFVRTNEFSRPSMRFQAYLLNLVA
jgi:hypothetical protein